MEDNLYIAKVASKVIYKVSKINKKYALTINNTPTLIQNWVSRHLDEGLSIDEMVSKLVKMQQSQ